MPPSRLAQGEGRMRLNSDQAAHCRSDDLCGGVAILVPPVQQSSRRRQVGIRRLEPHRRLDAVLIGHGTTTVEDTRRDPGVPPVRERLAARSDESTSDDRNGEAERPDEADPELGQVPQVETLIQDGNRVTH